MKQAMRAGAVKAGAMKALAASTIVAAALGGGVGTAVAATPGAPAPHSLGFAAVTPVDAPVAPPPADQQPGTTKPRNKAEALPIMLNELGKGFANGGGAGTAIGGLVGLVIGCLSMFPGSLAGCIIGAPTGAATGAAIGTAMGNPQAGPAIQDYLNAPN